MNHSEPSALRLALSHRALILKAPGTSSMRSKANALKESGIKVINFAAGELSFDASADMKAGAIDAINGARNRYTPPIGLPQLRERLAQQVSQRCGVPYAANEVAVTAGAKQALYNAAMVLLNPGDEVIVPTPYWENSPTQILLAGATPVYVDTRGNDYRLTCKAVERALSPRTKMIVINTPNNPTGTVYQREELRKIAKLAFDHRLWVVFDECYRKLVRHPHEHHNIVSLFPALKNQTVLVDSFSKSQAVTGWRIGYACAPAQVIAAMHNLQGHTTSHPSSLAQYAALNALIADSPDFARQINTFLDSQLQAACTSLGYVDAVTCAPPEGAFYLYIDVSRKLGCRYLGTKIRDVDHLADLLLSEAHIAVVPGSGCGDPNSIRISYAVEREELIEGMTRFVQFMADVVAD
ncbi:pyridoxal phosphate-dependent aminotransferase [Pseudomonas sp. ANT_J12]|uniref:pyridoxal phosphate-dependent aminotransferase n=1 Tax=Pseudomonas sp. ANT_J12 TaxID=2597351 RepID=UPI0011F3A408|nr:pyridoxal phosphate-dependent aminotransferase [Pseudomonas sp. ANT_J12]KAA0987968.1 pyridoxal phosphate-dependent aminotransferase [Pseudomonas sp. ANT_J12]